MKIFANLLSTSIDMRTTATYEITLVADAPFEASGSVYLDVHATGHYSNTNLKAGTAAPVARELVKRYVAAQGNWPKHHEIEWKVA
jgi:hypothetical protein